MKITIIIFAILIILLTIPVILYVSYSNENGFSLKLRYIFKFKILPQKKKKIKQKEKKQSKINKEEKSTENKKLGLKDVKELISLVLDLIKALKKPLIKFLKRIKFKNVVLNASISKEDAAQTAIFYGEVMAYSNGVYAALSNFFSIKLKKINIYPNFVLEKDESQVDFSFTISASLFFVFALILTSLGRGIIAFFKHTSKKDNLNKNSKDERVKGENYGRTSNSRLNVNNSSKN